MEEESLPEIGLLARIAAKPQFADQVEGMLHGARQVVVQEQGLWPGSRSVSPPPSSGCSTPSMANRGAQPTCRLDQRGRPAGHQDPLTVTNRTAPFSTSSWALNPVPTSHQEIDM